MTGLLFGILLAALLSGTSLLVILLRVSPLLTPLHALPAFFASVFLTIGTVSAVIFYSFWNLPQIKRWDAGKRLSISLRQGIFFSLATIVLILFHLWGLLNWWIGILIYLTFVIIEAALWETGEE